MIWNQLLKILQDLIALFCKKITTKRRVSDLTHTGEVIVFIKFYDGRVDVRSDKEFKLRGNGTPHFLMLGCTANPLKCSLEDQGKFFGLQKELLTEDVDHEKVYEGN